jgi:cyclopropane-fatty-acyl-phospholipid synthase
MFGVNPDRQLAAARNLAEELACHLDIAASIRLWDGTTVPLGRGGANGVAISIAEPGVIASLLRRPTLDRLIRHYAHGQIGIEGGTLIDLGAQLSDGGTRKRLKRINKARLFRNLLPFLFAPAARPARSRDFAGDEIGEGRRQKQNQDFIKFHYDVGNDFYRLFLDPEMQYSCAYFTEGANSLEQAQRDKLEMICRKLRLKPGERFLDIGCGWGGLICHAAKNCGVSAHGITLSENQLEFARAKVKRLGLEDRVTVELKDYSGMSGTFDKIASIGMYEHIGLKNIPGYMQKMRSLLSDDGLFLNHAIARRAPKESWFKPRLRPEQRAIAKYIFPGGELDDIGHSVFAMERAGFEVHDVEAWRMHYARTCKLWCERLTAERERAISFVGEEKYRIWVAYLAGVSLAFSRGTLRIFQTLVSKNAKRPPAIPPTRADLYR